MGTPRRSIAPGTVRQLGEAHWEIRIDRELKSPNKTLWAHWRLKMREREDWEQALTFASVTYAGMTTAAGLGLVKRSLSLFIAEGAKERRTVAVVREVPSTRHFIRDDDNLAFSVKPLFDAMKRVGMITDDKREFLRAAPTVQRVASDGAMHTAIELKRGFDDALVASKTAHAGGLYV